MGKLTSYGIYLAIALGLAFPTGGQFKLLIPLFLAIILFFSFLKLEYSLKHFLRKELFYYLVIGLIVIPSVVFICTKNLDPNFRLGFFLVAISPTAIASVIIVDLIRGNRELAISSVALYNMISPLTYSLLLRFFFDKTDIVIPVRDIFIKLIIMIFIPFLIALAVKRFGKIKNKLMESSRYANSISIVLVIAIAVSSASMNLRELEVREIVILSTFVLIMTAGFFLSGFILSKDKKINKTLAITFGNKNSALATWVALSNFAAPAVIPIILYIIFQNLVSGILIQRYGD